MIPEFAPVTGRVHHDVYHVYTVDVHSVAARRLPPRARARRARAGAPARQPARGGDRAPRACSSSRPSSTTSERAIPTRPARGRTTPQSGAELCDAHLAAPRPRPRRRGRRAARSSRLHLSMYHVATRRDLDDPATIEEFCRPIRSRELLRDLYLLTIADISTTSPTAMTSWKARMLEELYIAADAELAGRWPAAGPRPRAHGSVSGTRPWRSGTATLSCSERSCRRCPCGTSCRTARRGGRGSRARRRGARGQEGARRLRPVAPPRRRRALRRRRRPARAPRAHRRRHHGGAPRGARRPGLLPHAGVVPAAVRVGARETEGSPRRSTSSGCATGSTGSRGPRAAVPPPAARPRAVCSGRADAAARLLRTRTGSPWRERPSPARADRGRPRRPRLPAPHGRRGVREGPAGAPLQPRRGLPRPRICRSRSPRSTPKGRASRTFSTCRSSTARRSRRGALPGDRRQAAGGHRRTVMRDARMRACDGDERPRASRCSWLSAAEARRRRRPRRSRASSSRLSPPSQRRPPPISRR